MKITGIILAGGKSSRMETDKGLLLLEGIPMIQHVINALKPVVFDIIIVSNNKEYQQFNYPVFEDLIKEKGPIGGIYTGLSNTNTETNIIVTCDTPFVSSKLFDFLIKKSINQQITIPKFNDKIHYLIGVYAKKCLPFLKKAIENNELRVGFMLQNINSKVIDLSLKDEFDEKTFANINTKEELEQFKK